MWQAFVALFYLLTVGVVISGSVVIKRVIKRWLVSWLLVHPVPSIQMQHCMHHAILGVLLSQELRKLFEKNCRAELVGKDGRVCVCLPLQHFQRKVCAACHITQ